MRIECEMTLLWLLDNLQINSDLPLSMMNSSCLKSIGICRITHAPIFSPIQPLENAPNSLAVLYIGMQKDDEDKYMTGRKPYIEVASADPTRTNGLMVVDEHCSFSSSR